MRIRRLLKRVVVGIAALLGALVLLVVAVEVLRPKPPNRPAPYDRLPASTTALANGRILFDSNRTGSFEIYSMRADGSDVRRLTLDERYDSWWPRLSPDRKRILFYRTPAGVHDRDYSKTALWMMAADGGDLLEMRPAGTDGWEQQGHAEWSPDGERLVMFGGSRSNPQIYLTAATGRNPRQLTRRPGTNIDPAWSPDGATIVFVGCPRAICFDRNYEIYTMPVAGGDATRLTDDALRDHDPVFSPDGTRIAWLTKTSDEGPVGAWNIRLARVGRAAIERVTDDEHVNSRPDWSPDGALLYFHRLELGTPGFQIYAIRPDGTGMRAITAGQPGDNEYPDA